MAANKQNRLYLVIISVLILILTILLVLNLQKNQSLSESSASGFGTEATKDLYESTAELFLNADCNNIFYSEILKGIEYTSLNALQIFKVEKQQPLEEIPLICEYNLNNDKLVRFVVYTYSPTAYIDNTREELHNRINSATIKNMIDVDRIGIIDYYMGEDSGDLAVCRTNLFHPLNDFEYATIEFEGFDCNSFYNQNREITSIFGNYLVISSEYIYNTYANKSTVDLLREWEYDEYVEGLNFYIN